MAEPEQPVPRGPDPYHTIDFPYRRTLDSLVTRREYLRLMALTSAGLFLGSLGVAVRSLFPLGKGEPRVRIARAQDVPAGGSLNFAYPGGDSRALLLHLPDGQFRAFEQQCTHLECPVVWNSKTQQLECPCHEGFFDPLTGLVIAGPPPRRLPRVRLEMSGGDIYAVGVER